MDAGLTVPNPFALDPAELRCWVEGDPKPQGSKTPKGRRRNGSVVLVESADVGPWRDRVERAVRLAGVRLAGPVSVGLDFHLRRPANPKYPGAPAGPPDLDKLARAVLDALEAAEAVENDARVVEFHHLAKHWAAPGGAGVHITVRKVQV